jgi:hypothetical protein
MIPTGRSSPTISSAISKCTACHNPQNQAIHKKTCPVGKQACTSCHMQRVGPPDAHHAFPDHWFRVVKPKAAYPE